MLQNQAEHSSSVDLKISGDHVAFDPRQNALFTHSNHRTYVSTRNTAGELVTQPTEFLRSQLTEEERKELAKRQNAGKKGARFMQFAKSDNITTDITRLTARVTKIDPILTTLKLSTRSLVFEIHEVCTSGGLKFMVQGETETFTSTDFKSECPTTYTFHWDAEAKTLNLYVRRTKKTSLAVKAHGHFGIIPLQTSSVYTINPYKSFFVNEAVQVQSILVGLELLPEQTETIDTVLSAHVAEDNKEFKAIRLAQSEDNKFQIYVLTGTLTACPSLNFKPPTGITFVEFSWQEDLKPRGQLSEELKTFIRSKKDLLTKGFDWSSASSSDAQPTNALVAELEDKHLTTYVKASDSLLFYSENSIKLIKRRGKSFPLRKGLFEDAVASADSQVTVELDRLEAQLLVEGLKHEDFVLSDSATIPRIQEFISKVTSALSQNSNSQTVIIRGHFKQTLETLVTLITVLVRNISLPNQLCSLINSKKKKAEGQPEAEAAADSENHNVMHNLFDEPVEDEKKEPAAPQVLQYTVKNSTRIIMAARVLLELFEQLRAKSQLLTEDVEVSEVGLSYSAEFRLSSFILSKYIGRDFLELANHGLYNSYSSFCHLNHYLHEDTPLSGLGSGELRDQALYSVFAQNGIDLREETTLLNVDLSTFINNSPALIFPDAVISRVEVEPAFGAIGVYFESGELRLYDTSAGLVELFRGNLNDSSHKTRIRSSLMDKKNKFMINLADNVPEDVFSKIAEHKKPLTSEENPHNIIPDPLKLDQIYKMGFPFDLAKKALVKTKNQSIDAAVELLLAMDPVALQVEEESLRQAVSLIKPEWTCKVCTFINVTDELSESKEICICGTPAPLDAYYSKEEVEQLKEVQAQMLAAEKQQEEFQALEMRKIEEAQNLTDCLPGKVVSFKISSLQHNFLSRYLVAAIFQADDKSQSTLRIRRIGYCSKYIKSLLSDEVDGVSTVTILAVGNQIVIDSEQVSQEQVFADLIQGAHRLQVDNLIPAYSYESKPMTTIDQQDIVIADETLQLFFDESSTELVTRDIEGVGADKKTQKVRYESKFIYILSKSATGALKLSKYQILVKLHDFFDPSSQIELIKTVEIGKAEGTIEFLSTGSSSSTISVLVGDTIKAYSKADLEVQGSPTVVSKDLKRVVSLETGSFGIGNTIIQLPRPQGATSVPEVTSHIVTAADASKQLTCDDILAYLHNREFIQFEVSEGVNCISALPDGDFGLSHCAKVVPASTTDNVEFKLVPGQTQEKNNVGIICLSLSLNTTATSPVPVAPEQPKTTEALVSSPNLDKSEEDHLIPLRVAHQSFDGLNHQSFLGASVFAGPGAHIFSGKRAEVNLVIFENQFELDMIIKQLTIQSKPGTNEDAIESALVFSTNSTGISNKFDLRFLGKQYEYKQWLKTKPTSTDKWEEWEPVAFLSLGDGKATQGLDHVRTARYLCLVFSLPSKKMQNFRLNQIVAKGSCLHRSERVSISLPKQTKEVVETGFELTVVNGSTTILQNKKLLIDSTPSGLNLVLNLNFYEELKDLRFTITNAGAACFGIESITAQIIKRSSGEESGLKELFENQDKLVGLLQSQSKRLSQTDIDFEEKKKILALILDISNEFSLELIDKIQESVDIDYFVRYLILQRPDQEFFRTVSDFVEKFKRSELFAERLSASFAKHLEQIEEVELSVETLKNFFRLIDASISHPKFSGLKQNLQDLVTKSLTKLDETNTNEHKALHALGVKANIFDPTSFWNLESPNLTGAKSGDDFSDFFPVSYLTVKSLNQIELYCDLGRESSVGRLLLKFLDISTVYFDTFPFLTLDKFDLGPTNDWSLGVKQQILGQRVDHSFLMFSNKAARQQGVTFYSDKHWFNALGYRIQGVSGRYFRIRLHFDTSKQAKTFYKLNKHNLQPHFLPIIGEQIPQPLEAGFTPVLPEIAVNSAANITMGELSVVKTVSNVTSFDHASNAARATQARPSVASNATPSSSIPQPQGDKGEASSSSAAAVEEPIGPNPLVKLQKAIEDVRLILQDAKISLLESDDVTYLRQLMEGITTERDNLEKGTLHLAVGQHSFNFWITILDLAGSNPNLQKCAFQLTLDHCKSALRNVISLKVNPRVRDIVMQLMKKSVTLEKPQASLKTLRKLVEFVTTNMSVAQYPGVTLPSLIKTLHEIFSEQKHFPVYDLVDHILNKLCSSYTEANKDTIVTQMTCFFDLIFLFNTQVKKEVEGQENEGYASEISNLTLNILLWVYEQETLNLPTRDSLSEKAIKLIIQVLTQAKQVLIKTFKLEAGLFEMLWLRSLKLGVYKSLEPLYGHLVGLAAVQDSNKIAEDLQTLNQDVLNYVVIHLKGEEDKHITEILNGGVLQESAIYEYMGFLFKNLDIINKQISSKKKETAPANSKKPEEVKITRKRTVEDPATTTPALTTATRSLSVNSVEKPEEESALNLIIKDVIQLYKKKLTDSKGVGIPTLYIETAKLVFSRAGNREFLKSFIDLFLSHKVSDKTLITNDLLGLISDTMDNLKKSHTGEPENNKVLREFSSNLLIILVEYLTTKGVEHLDIEEVKLIIFIQELLFGSVEAKKGLTASIKTLTSPLTIGCVSKIFYSTARELSRLCNWGGPDGYDSLERSRLNYLDILMNFLAIINAASSGSKSLTLNDMVANLKSSSLTEVVDAIYQLLEWNVFNNIPTTKKSPAADRLVKISSYIDQILKAIAENPEAGKIMIKKAFDIVSDVHTFLAPKIGSEELNFVVINTVYNLFMVLEHVLELTLKDNHMINYFIVECKGIHFIFDLLHLSHSATQAVNQELAKETVLDEKGSPAKSDHLQSIKKRIQDVLEKQGLSKIKPALAATAPTTTVTPATTAAITTTTLPTIAGNLDKGYLLQTPSSTVPAQSVPAVISPMPALTTQNYKTFIPCVQPEKFSEEFGKDLKCLTKINGKDEKTTDWSKHKKTGSKQILLYTMQNDFTKNSREWVLDFQLSGPADLKTIKAGFLAQFNDHGSKTIAEPTYILVHYKCKDAEPWRYLCELERFEDNSYAASATACYQKNFMRFEGSTFQDRMESVCIPKRIEYLRFLIGKPVVSFQEGYSTTKNKDANQFVLAPSYISVLGINSKQYNLVQLTNYIRETSLLKLLHKVFSKDQKSFDSVSSQSDVISKFKTIFERLMEDYVDLFTTPLVSFSRTNQDFALWVMKKLLDLRFKDEHTKVIGEVIMASPEHYQSRVSILCDFILSEISACVTNNKDVVDRLYSFMGVFSSCISRGQKDAKNVNTLNVAEPEVNLLIKFFNKTSVVQSFKSFFITLINMPNPSFTLKISNPKNYLIDELTTRITTDEDFILAELLSLVALSNPAYADRLIDDSILDLLFKKLNTIQKKPKISVLLFFRNCINHSKCLQKAITLKLVDNLFNSLKTEVENDSNPPSDKVVAMVPLHLDIIKYIVSIDEASRQECAEMILNYFKGIATNQKEVLYFLETVILPILFTVQTQKVFFSKKAPTRITLGEEETMQTDDPLKGFKLKSDYLPAPMVPTLISGIDQLLDDSAREKFKAANWECIGSTAKLGKSDLTPQIEESLIGQGPFMILIDGEATNQEYVLGIYCSTGIPADSKGKPGAREIIINNSDNHFIFLYERGGEQTTCHYKTKSTNETETFIKFVDKGDSAEKGLFVYFQGTERVVLSFSDPTTNHIDLYPMKCLESDPKPNFEFPYDFHVKRGVEIWKISKPPTNSNSKEAKGSIFSMGLLRIDNELFNISHSYYRNSPVYNLPSKCPLNVVKKVLFNDETIEFTSIPSNRVVDDKLTIEQLKGEFPPQDSLDILDLEYTKDVDVKETTMATLKENFLSETPVLDHFIKIDGFDLILSSCQNIITISPIWQEKNSNAANWEQILKEIRYYSKIPQFIPVFAANSQSIQTLFKIVSQAKLTDKIWATCEETMNTTIYSALQKVFMQFNDPSLRELVIQEGILGSILEKLASVSKETKRKWTEVTEVKPEVIKEVKKTETSDNPNAIVKRKGVGYENGVTNTNWSTEEFFKLAEAKNKKIKGLLQIILSIFDQQTWNWQPPTNTMGLICESCLLPLIENNLRCTSLLDWVKEKELYELYLNIILAMSKVEKLLPTLVQLDEKYKPSQTASIEKLLSSLYNSAETFKKLTPAEIVNGKGDDPNRVAYGLAEKIIHTYESVTKSISQSSVKDKNALDAAAILQLPMEDQYRILLERHRFGYVNMKEANDETKYVHHWKAEFAGKYSPSSAKMGRLAQEVADISNSLTVESTNAMFVRADEERLDVMKAIIFGAEGCPYAHGAFEYHIYFTNDYPAGPPKVNLATTGNGDVRFNPNLYSCGKVCLSLLGTWRGSASESWDPKFSTLSQVLVSIQAVVMSEEVYFNEPNYGHEAGTEQGELRNNGYSNIVRLCNVKHAMIGQIENPPKGFELVVRAHFALKKDTILKTVREWIKWSTEKDASYSNLVSDHNQSYAERFKNKPTAYAEELATAVAKLEKILDSLEMPPVDQLLGSKMSQTKITKGKVEDQAITDGQAKIEEIDMTYDENVQHKSMANDEAGVMDRWSRYIGVMGLESVTKQANASVFISGLNSLGVEVAKNIVLSGAKRITLHDSKPTTWTDLAGQFFLGEADIGKNRATCTISKLQQLNFYVKVDQLPLQTELPQEEAELEKLGLKDYEVIVLIDTRHHVIAAVSKLCRKYNRALVVADCYGIFSRVFCDFGPKFICFDKNGEEPPEVMIANITSEENGKVTLLEGVKHMFEDGETIMLRGVEGMGVLEGFKPQVPEGVEVPTSINGMLFKVKVINFNSFFIGDTRGFDKYVRGGLAKLVKVPQDIVFEPYHEVYQTATPKLESNLEYHDFMKVDHPRILHLAFLSLEDFYVAHKRLPEPYAFADAKELLALVQKRQEATPDFVAADKLPAIKKLISRFAMTLGGNFGPQSAFIGGLVCQEIVKAITGKFKPIVQTLYADSMEVLDERLFPENVFELKDEEFSTLVEQSGVKPKNHRDDGVRILLGNDLLTKVKEARLFMVGSGAIGCELLKNYAMIGLGTGKPTEKNTIGGQIILTDPDVIEVSNLNRQFLFREKHLRKPKSVTAAAAAQLMNPELQGRLVARLDKVHEGTSNIFSDKFFQELTIVTNALDNVQARKYIDSRCVTARTPLLESGTLGPKGHVQVVIPNKTESYGSMQDPVEEIDIPHCTLKMFPEETLHCVEWARDLFGSLFTQAPQALRKCLEEGQSGLLAGTDPKALKDAVELASQAPNNFDDCVVFARNKFQKYFHDDILQLLYVYPLDFKDKDGNPFWKLPKRPPGPILFDQNNKLHREFIVAMAALRAKIFSVPLPPNIRDEDGKNSIASAAAGVKVDPFLPSDEKAKEISKDVEKVTKAKDAVPAEPAPVETEMVEAKEDTLDSLKDKIKAAGNVLSSEKITPEEFEKDDDKNYHIDAIYSMANLRATNYKLDEMDWITVKIKAGRIVPALATTTASIAGLQTIEVVKVLKDIKVEHIKNAFLNIAVPILTQSEPAEAPKIKLNDKVTVTLWDRWEFRDCSKKTLGEIFAEIEQTYGLYPRDVLHGAKSVFMRALSGAADTLTKPLTDLFGAAPGDHEDVTVTCSLTDSDNKLLTGVPTVRLTF